MRLIDADAFVEDIKTEIMNLYLDGMKGTPRPFGELYDIIDRIGEQPAIDAVEVVRCKDCKYFLDYKRTSMLINGKNAPAGWCVKWARIDSEHRALPEDFCSYGKRRNDETN